MESAPPRVCPAQRAGSLDNRFRRLLQNPRRILSPYVREGMTVLDIGCGPGFFTTDLADMVGDRGRVIACDIQPAMLEKLRHKVRGTALESRIVFHQCRETTTGLTEPVDFILAFYMVHEAADQTLLLRDLCTLLKPQGLLFLVEPPIHVSKTAFAETLRKAQEAGLTMIAQPAVRFSKTALLQK